MTALIEADKVSVYFRAGFRRKAAIRALDGLSLSIEEGDFFALLGENGAGKSTAMYSFLGLVKPTSGRISLFGQTPKHGSEVFRTIAYLPEEPHYHSYLTVAEAIEFYGTLYGKIIPKTRIDDLIERLGLSQFRDLRIDKCSKGMKQKVGIAQCLIAEPALLFLDEPTRGLDPVIVKQFRDVLSELNKNGTTIVINSHILSEIEMVANRVAVIKQGKVVRQARLQDLLVVDRESYVVELEESGRRASGGVGGVLPDYFEITDRSDSTVRGAIPAARLAEFVEYISSSEVRLTSCALKRQTLEQSFFDIIAAPGDEGTAARH